MSKVTVSHQSGSYDVILEPGILSSVGIEAARLISGRRAAVITDDCVRDLYFEKVEASLKGAGFTVSLFAFLPGEESKNSQNLFKIYSFLSACGITRSDVVIALGGGVAGDLAGFAASTYMRGVPYFQLPTTLLAQVDSSIGGKTAIDLPEGKNLVGSFYQPCGVLCDTQVLTSLPDRIFSDGMAEVIKYGCIASEGLFEKLYSLGYNNLKASSQDLCDVVYECAKIKAQIVSSDERDSGIRNILNFGHTMGHAIEKLSSYSNITHGQGVSIGMHIAARIGENLGITMAGTSNRIEKLLLEFNLPVSCGFSADQLTVSAMTDKKIMSTTLRLILLKAIGSAVIYPIETQSLSKLLKDVL